jgi:hypothetical protein
VLFGPVRGGGDGRLAACARVIRVAGRFGVGAVGTGAILRGLTRDVQEGKLFRSEGRGWTCLLLQSRKVT